jgi:hypothetical protein
LPHGAGRPREFFGNLRLVALRKLLKTDLSGLAAHLVPSQDGGEGKATGKGKKKKVGGKKKVRRARSISART